MNNLRLLVSLCLVTASLLASAGCTSNVTDANGTSSGNPPPASSGLAGSYAGSYGGDDSGPVTMTITGDKVDVVATVGGKQYPGSGQVSGSGGVSVGLGAGNGVTVTFQGTFGSGKGSGTWSSSIGTKGSWSVAK
jgi:hypothetical protein